MKNYKNEEIKYSGCPACAYGNHEFSLPCGIAYESNNFILSQDWELPIEGFFVISPKRHIEKLSELTISEKSELFEIIDKTIEILTSNNICDYFNIIMPSKSGRHFHVWIMPRYPWMRDLGENIMINLKMIFDYAKNNFRTEEVYNKINNITDIVRKGFESK